MTFAGVPGRGGRRDGRDLHHRVAHFAGCLTQHLEVFVQAVELLGDPLEAGDGRAAADLLAELAHAFVDGLQAIVEGGFLTDGDTPVGAIDPERVARMAKFLFDSGVLKGTDGQPLDWPGSVADWYDQGWMDQ